MEQILKIMRVNKDAVVPKKATTGSAGLDLCACIKEEITLFPGSRAVIPTGIAIELQDHNCAGMIFARSGLSIKHGVSLSNGVGVIDSDYRGEICIGLCNQGKQPYAIQPGERVAQLIVMPVIPVLVQESENLSETGRADGGFGSTGKK